MKVDLTFYLDEEVTPTIFVQRVATGLSRSGTIRVGEKVGYEDTIWERCEDQPFDLFGNGKLIDLPHIRLVKTREVADDTTSTRTLD